MGKTNSSMLTCKGQESQGQRKAGALRKEWPKGLVPLGGRNDTSVHSEALDRAPRQFRLEWRHEGSGSGLSQGCLPGVD